MLLRLFCLFLSKYYTCIIPKFLDRLMAAVVLSQAPQEQASAEEARPLVNR